MKDDFINQIKPLLPNVDYCSFRFVNKYTIIVSVTRNVLEPIEILEDESVTANSVPKFDYEEIDINIYEIQQCEEMFEECITDGNDEEECAMLFEECLTDLEEEWDESEDEWEDEWEDEEEWEDEDCWAQYEECVEETNDPEECWPFYLECIEEEEYEEEDAPQQEELTDGETTQPQQKDVFYAGTRRRDS